MGELTSIGSAGEQAQVSRTLSSVLLEEWGGPRSPLALSYLQNIIIPSVVNCLAKNADLLLNPTFADIIAWKLKSQYAYPQAVVDSLTADILKAVLKISRLPQNCDPQEPWRRILRLHVAGKSLPDVEKETGYPLAYLNLLLIRLSKLRKYLDQTGASYRECLANPELQEYGAEQLSFLYQFHQALATEPLYKEKLILEQVSVELGVPWLASDLVELLTIVHAQEGSLDEEALISVLREKGWKENLLHPDTSFPSPVDSLSAIIEGLTALEFLRRSGSGELFLTERGATTIASFLVPELLEQLKIAGQENHEQARQILLGLNPEVLLPVLKGITESFSPDVALPLLKALYKQVNRRIDLYLVTAWAKYEGALDLLITGLGDNDSLIRAKACEALGNPGNLEAVISLIQLLGDPVAKVREMAAQALGEIGSPEGFEALSRVSEDHYESPNVRGQAREALRKILK